MPQAPVEFMRGNTRYANLGTKAFSEFEDPDEISNPFHLQRRAANAQLRGLEADTERREFAASPDRQRIDAIRNQQAADYDLEFNAPRRVDMMGKVGVQQAEAAARAAAAGGEIEADAYFNPMTRAKREDERGFKERQFNTQYGLSADANRYRADRTYQGNVDKEQIRAGGNVERERTRQLPNLRGQMIDEGNQVLPGNEGKVGEIDQQLGIGARPFSRRKVQAFADRYFGGDVAAAEEQIAQDGYYIAEDQ